METSLKDLINKANSGTATKEEFEELRRRQERLRRKDEKLRNCFRGKKVSNADDSIAERMIDGEW